MTACLKAILQKFRIKFIKFYLYEHLHRPAIIPLSKLQTWGSSNNLCHPQFVKNDLKSE